MYRTGWKQSNSNSAVGLCASSNCLRPNWSLVKKKGLKKEIMSNGRSKRRNRSGELKKKCEELRKESKTQDRKEGRVEGGREGRRNRNKEKD